MIRFNLFTNHKSEICNTLRKTSFAKIAFIVSLALSGYSCEGLPTAPGQTGLREDKGTLLHSNISTSFATFLWSQNADEIIIAGESGIRVFNVASLAERSIESAGRVYTIKLSKDGSGLYYFLGDLYGGILPLYRISLAGNDRRLLLNNVASSFALLSDSLIAYSPMLMSSSIYLHTVGGGTDTMLTTGWYPLTFSPDGKQLLYIDSDLRYFTVSLENKAAQQIPFYPERFEGSFRWNTNGIQVIYFTIGEGYFYKNITTNESFKIAGYDIFPSKSWSPDGNKFAYWTSQCIKNSGGLFSCDLYQDILHVVDVNTKKETIVAVHNREVAQNTPSSIAFSHDNSKIAYGLGNHLFTKNIP